MSSKNSVYRRKCIKDKNDEVEKSEGTGFQQLLDFCHDEKDGNYSLESFVKFLHKPVCSSSLGAVRALFGLVMMIDIPDERGLANLESKFGDPMRCHFPLFDWLFPLPFEYMGLLYCMMWLGALGMCLGYKFQKSCLMFTLPYWYIYLLDKTVWNNHSYLFGLVSILFTFTNANHSLSLDGLFDPSIRNKPVPLWNYAIIRFQFFLLYFYAGLKKFDPDWIGGYSMNKLSLHWVFDPFRLVLNNDQIDFWIIHIFGFLFDLTVGFFLLIDKTRPVAMIFLTAFHLMNSCMFYIGQFPYLCLVTTPIFCSYDWPERFWKNCKQIFINTQEPDSTPLKESMTKALEKNESDRVPHRQKITCCLLAIYVVTQLFLPYSHFITQGYNNWTNGLYGYSWDMMVQNWDSDVIVIKVVDNQSKEEFFLDPEAWVENTRYSKHGDMLVQYAKCLKRNLNSPEISNRQGVRSRSSFSDISIYIDVWSSLNGRFQQRMFDPKQDLLTAEWNPFQKISWLMPLLSDLTPWRKDLMKLEEEVFKWSNYSDVQFFADFPGLSFENYINADFTNVTVTVLKGTVILEQLHHPQASRTINVTLYKGESSKVKVGMFHKIYTISKEPSCYMYTYNNYTLEKLGEPEKKGLNLSVFVIKEMIKERLTVRLENFIKSLILLRDCFYKLLFDTPIPLKNKQDDERNSLERNKIFTKKNTNSHNLRLKKYNQINRRGDSVHKFLKNDMVNWFLNQDI